MSKWLYQINAPTLMLWLFALAFCISWSFSPKESELLSSIGLPFILASWVMADARKRGRQVCYDYDAFVYFAWPIVVPVYLFQTRGTRSFLTLLCFAGIWLLAAGIGFLLREFIL